MSMKHKRARCWSWYKQNCYGAASGDGAQGTGGAEDTGLRQAKALCNAQYHILTTKNPKTAVLFEHSNLQGGAETLLTSSEIVGTDPRSEARAFLCIGKISNNLEAKDQLTLKTKAQNTFQAPKAARGEEGPG